MCDPFCDPVTLKITIRAILCHAGGGWRWYAVFALVCSAEICTTSEPVRLFPFSAPDTRDDLTMTVARLSLRNKRFLLYVALS